MFWNQQPPLRPLLQRGRLSVFYTHSFAIGLKQRPRRHRTSVLICLQKPVAAATLTRKFLSL